MKVLGVSLPTGTWGFKPRHLLIIVVILSILVLGLYVFTVHSDAYEDAEHFARTDPEVAKRIGQVLDVKLKFWDGFHVTYSGSGGEASFIFGLRSEREESILDVRLNRKANSWRVEEAYLSTKNEKRIPIVSVRRIPS